MEFIDFKRGIAPYPLDLTTYLGDEAPARLVARGNLKLMPSSTSPCMALFSSVTYPGQLMLRLPDLARHLRQMDITVGGGFNSPLEKECLTLFLRGGQPLVMAPVSSLTTMRLPPAWQTALQQERLLLLSPFRATRRRPTTEMTDYRNRVIAALASHIFIAYAAPGGKIEQLCREMIAWHKPVYTFESFATRNLIALGAFTGLP